MFASVITLLTLAMVIMLYSLCSSRDSADRIMSINCFTSYSVVLIAVIAIFNQHYYLLDIAFVYALVGYMPQLGFLNILVKINDLVRVGFTYRRKWILRNWCFWLRKVTGLLHENACGWSR